MTMRTGIQRLCLVATADEVWEAAPPLDQETEGGPPECVIPHCLRPETLMPHCLSWFCLQREVNFLCASDGKEAQKEEEINF